MTRKTNFSIMLIILAAGSFLIIAAGFLLVQAGRRIDLASGTVYLSQELFEIETELQTEPEKTRAQQVMEALAQAYPQQIQRAEFRENDWAVLLRDTWYFYAEGRILPQDKIENKDEYNSVSFYNYRHELPEWKTPTPEEQERFKNMADNRAENPIRRSPYFLDALWRSGSRAEAYERVKTMKFLGQNVTVHYMIMENLSLVEEEIMTAAKADPQVQAWVRSISSLAGWGWRNIAETESRSYHSYGLAVDIIPRSYGGREVYWLWTSNHQSDWWNVPYSRRYHPPQAVVKAFENYGFIWGGKWPTFDTIHYEYRPEILILSGMPPKVDR